MNLTYNLAGHWLTLKYREQAKLSGTYRAALNLRKAGFPLWLALMVLRSVKNPALPGA